MKVYQAIARKLAAYYCEGTPLAKLASDYLPSGSGVDSGTKIDDASRPDRIVLNFGFHHMSEYGFYCGWSQWSAIVTPSLSHGFDLRVQCHGLRDLSYGVRNMIDPTFRDYLVELFDDALRQNV